MAHIHTYADVCIYQAVFVRRVILEPPCPFGSAGHVSDTNALWLPSQSQAGQSKAERARAGTWLNGFVGSFHGTQLHKCQLWGLKLVPQHGGWEEREGEERGGSSNVATLYAVCCACCCVSVGVCFYYTSLTCSTSVSLSLSLLSVFLTARRLLACLPKSIQRRNSRWRQLKVQSWMCPSILKDIVSTYTHTSTVQQGFSHAEQKLKVKWD